MSALRGTRATPRERTGSQPGSLRVALETGDPVADAALGVVTIHVQVVGARAPVSLSLYVDGDLAETWTQPEASFDFSLDEHGPGRHVVTTRAVDTLGRWAGASMIVSCTDSAETG